LFFAHGYEGVDVRQVADRANIGRSTFYRHFRSKEDLLVQSLEPLFRQIAQASISDEQPEHLQFVCEHFWENRRLARAVFTGRSMILVVRALAGAIESRLADLPAKYRKAFPIPLIASQLASAQMAMLDEWLRGRGSCSPSEIARALHRSGRAVVQALLRPSA
jgi:AcrR family transcriptional regulator